MINRLHKSVKTNEFVANAVSILLNGGIIYVLAFISSVIAARALGPAGQGAVSIAVTVCGIGVQFGNFGLHAAVKYYVAKDSALLPSIMGNTIALFVMYGLLSAAMVGLFFLFPSISPLTGWMLAITAVLMPVRIIYMHLQSILISLNKVKLYNQAKLLQEIIYPILVGALFLCKLISPPLVFGASLIAALVPFIIVFRVCRRGCFEPPRPDFKLLLSILPYGIKAYVSCLLSYLIFRSDILMLKYFCGETLTGIYSIAATLADIFLMITSSVAVILTPKLVAQPTDTERFQFTFKILKILALIMLGVTIVASALCGWAIGIVYGDAYAQSADVFRVLMPGVLCWGLSSILSSYFSAVNKQGITIVAPAAAVIINIVLNLILIPIKGIIGAAIASSVAYFVNIILRGGWFMRLKLQDQRNNIKE